MKTTRIGRVLVAVALTCALWTTSAMAMSFDISGYTSTFWVAVAGTAGGPTSDPISGTGTNVNIDAAGKYTLSFSGGTGDLTNAHNLVGTLLFVDDSGSPI